jgi:arginyl-tRNA synthetase
MEFTAKAMGYGAVKYADLKNHRMTNYKFSFDAMLDLKGNTAIYLLYAHARICSIIRKSGVEDIEALIAENTLELGTDEEFELAMHIMKFPESIEDMMEEWTPNSLTSYLYELSVKFTDFYSNNKVLGVPEEKSRLMLCEATAVTMRATFALLGLTPVYKI